MLLSPTKFWGSSQGRPHRNTHFGSIVSLSTEEVLLCMCVDRSESISLAHSGMTKLRPSWYCLATIPINARMLHRILPSMAILGPLRPRRSHGPVWFKTGNHLVFLFLLSVANPTTLPETIMVTWMAWPCCHSCLPRGHSRCPRGVASRGDHGVPPLAPGFEGIRGIRGSG